MIRSEMLERMSAREFYEWMILEQIEPFGDRRGDIQTGQLLAMLANTNRTKKSDKVFGPLDFIPNWEPVPQAAHTQTPEEQMDTMFLLQKIQNARVANV